MNESHRYLVPDDYPAFSCKIGACRKPCCEGWPVSITMKDYFTLLSVDSSPELRRKLDCALHLPDGRCSLHAEVGADMLTATERMLTILSL